MSHSPLSLYNRAIQQCEIQQDDAQRQIVQLLQELYHQIHTQPEKRSLISRWLSNDTPTPVTYGLYLWGGVGRGKSMLMDMFYKSLSTERKWRVHFHDFMQYVHTRMHEHRKKNIDDPLGSVINDICATYDILCFDELQVHDITDASILSRLFNGLFADNITIVFTSNRPPEDLYLHGLQRERFLPFIDLLHAKLHIHEIQSDTDYRQNKIAALTQRYLYPLSAEHMNKLEDMFTMMCSTEAATPKEIMHKGRTLHIPRAHREVAWFDFKEICEPAYGAGDYLELAARYKVFFIANIPQLSKESRNEAKRFVTLIDVLYEARSTLCCTAQTPPQKLYVSGDGSFEFERTVSRLREMMSEEYER